MVDGIGKFAQGFATSFGQAQDRRRLRDQLELEQQERAEQREFRERTFGLDVLQFENQLQQQERAAGVQQQQFGLQERQFGAQQEQFGQQQELSERRFGLEQQAEANRQKAQQNQETIQQRQLDMQALGMLNNLEKIPKGARKAFLNQLAPVLGIERDSPEFKDMVGAISGLDPEELKLITSQLRSIFPMLPPGQAAAFSMGVVSGRMTLNDAMSQVEKLTMQQARQRPRGGGVQSFNRLQAAPIPQRAPGTPATTTLEGKRVLDTLGQPSPLTGDAALPLQDGAEPEAEAAPAIETPQSLQQRAAQALGEAEEASRRGDTEFATRMESQARELRQMAADITAGKEFDPTQVEARETAKLTGAEAARKKQPINPALSDLLGIKGAGRLQAGQAEDMGIFTDIVGTKELRELRQAKSGTQNLVRNMDELSRSVQNQEHLLGVTGAGILFLDMIRSQAKGIAGLWRHVKGGNSKAFANNDVLRGFSIDSGLAGQSAVIRSRIVELAFDMAKANDDGRLSDQDFTRALEQIGASGSVEQLQSVLGDLSERFRTNTMSEIEAATGARPLDLMTPDELVEFSQDVEDERLLKAIIVEQRKAMSRQRKR